MGRGAAGTAGGRDTGSAGTDSAGTGPAGPDAGAAEPEVLPVLPDPVPRDAERALARFGLLGEGAAPAFTPGARYPLAGLLLALPPLAQSGLLACARQVYGRLRNGFYGLEGMPVVLGFMALLREARAAAATRVRGRAGRRTAGEGRKPVLCFDRGGWSPALFADITDAGFDLLTYRKNDAGKDIPALPEDAFSAAGWTGDDGREHAYDLADTMTEVTIGEGEHKGRVLELRQATRPNPPATPQLHLLTTRPAAALPAAGVVYRMTSRWREANCLPYVRPHFALDALDTYAGTPE